MTAVAEAERAVADCLVWSPAMPAVDVELDPQDYRDPVARAVVAAWAAGPPKGWQGWQRALLERGVPGGLAVVMGPCAAPWVLAGQAEPAVTP